MCVILFLKENGSCNVSDYPFSSSFNLGCPKNYCPLLLLDDPGLKFPTLSF
jgi:hypothetical protein